MTEETETDERADDPEPTADTDGMGDPEQPEESAG